MQALNKSITNADFHLRIHAQMAGTYSVPSPRRLNECPFLQDLPVDWTSRPRLDSLDVSEVSNCHDVIPWSLVHSDCGKSVIPLFGCPAGVALTWPVQRYFRFQSHLIRAYSTRLVMSALFRRHPAARLSKADPSWLWWIRLSTVSAWPVCSLGPI